MKNYYLRLIVSSAVAGLIMALAGFELIAMDAQGAFIAGGFIQGFGLLIVLYFGLYLSTSHLTDVFTSENKKRTIFSLLIALAINIGVIIAVGYLLRVMTDEDPGFIASAEKFVSTRIVETHSTQNGKDWYMALISGVMCGVILNLTSTIYKKHMHAFTRMVVVILGVGIYVVCRLENIMTNTLYIAYAHNWSGGTALDLAMVLLGNIIGIYLTYFAIKFVTPKPKKANKKQLYQILIKSKWLI